MNSASSQNSMSNDTNDVENGLGENIKKFLFVSKLRKPNSEPEEKLEILIPELLQAGYSFYTWPCAPILAWFLWEKRHSLAGKKILEIGSGTALPGILAAKCSADVILSDSYLLTKSLNHIHRCCILNNLEPGKDINITGLTWGLLLNNFFNVSSVDLIIGSDCFYDPSVFEDILVTVSYLLENNPSAKFITTYQERSSDWTIQPLLKKWNLNCVCLNLDYVAQNLGIDLTELMGDHTIHLLEITYKGVK